MEPLALNCQCTFMKLSLALMLSPANLKKASAIQNLLTISKQIPQLRMTLLKLRILNGSFTDTMPPLARNSMDTNTITTLVKTFDS